MQVHVLQVPRPETRGQITVNTVNTGNKEKKRESRLLSVCVYCYIHLHNLITTHAKKITKKCSGKGKKDTLDSCSHHVTHVVHAQVIWMQAHGGLQVVKCDKFNVSLPQLPPAQIFNLQQTTFTLQGSHVRLLSLHLLQISFVNTSSSKTDIIMLLQYMDSIQHHFKL